MSILARPRLFRRNLLFDFFKLVGRLWTNAGVIKQDPAKAKKFKKYALLGMMWATLAAASMYPVALGALTLFKLSFSNLGVFTYLVLIGNIFLFFVALLLLFIPFLFSVYSLAFPIAQMRVNRGFWSWFSLFYCIILILALLFIAIIGFAGGVSVLK